MHTKLTHEKYKEIYSAVPRLCVETVITNDEGGVLLTYRQIEPKNVWHLPGGTVLFGESLTDAAKRVAKSELGLDVEVKDNIGVIDFSHNINCGHAVSIVYSAKVIKGEIKLDFQASKAGYFKELPPDTLPEHYTFLKKIL